MREGRADLLAIRLLDMQIEEYLLAFIFEEESIDRAMPVTLDNVLRMGSVLSVGFHISKSEINMTVREKIHEYANKIKSDAGYEYEDKEGRIDVYLNEYIDRIELLLEIYESRKWQIEKNDDFIRKMSDAAQGNEVGIYRNIDSLELAEYIRTMAGELFAAGGDDKLINRILYRYIKHSFGAEWDANDRIAGYDHSTLKAVVGMMENRGIRRAITYNYDDLLEISLRQDGNQVETIVPEEKKEFAEGNDVYKVYHCHGLVPIRDSDEDDSVQTVSQIILTETSYYNEEASNYSLANVLQAYSMNYCNLLYVGFSGSDYTFRRIIRGLDLNKKEMQHYIFFCVDDIVNMVYDGVESIEITKDEFVRQVGSGNALYDYERLMINQLVVSKTLYWNEKGMNVI